MGRAGGVDNLYWPNLIQMSMIQEAYAVLTIVTQREALPLALTAYCISTMICSSGLGGVSDFSTNGGDILLTG